MEGTRGGVWMLLFPQVTLFEYTVPTPLPPIVPNGYKSYMCLDLLTSSLMNVSRDSCAFSTSCGGPSRETLSFSSLNSTWTWNQVNWLLNTGKTSANRHLFTTVLLQIPSWVPGIEYAQWLTCLYKPHFDWPVRLKGNWKCTSSNSLSLKGVQNKNCGDASQTL